MSFRHLFVCAAIFTAAIFSANPSWAQGESRFGVWDNSTDPNNVMTYEAFEKGGSKLTVSNPSKPGTEWSYETFFDGKFRPVAGRRTPRRPSRSSIRRASAFTTSAMGRCTRW